MNGNKRPFGSGIGTVLIFFCIIIGGIYLFYHKSDVGQIKTYDIAKNPRQANANLGQAVAKFAVAGHHLGNKVNVKVMGQGAAVSEAPIYPTWISDNRMQNVTDFASFNGPYLLLVFKNVEDANRFKPAILQALNSGVPLHTFLISDARFLPHEMPIFLQKIIYNNYSVPQTNKDYGVKNGKKYTSLTLINADGEAVQSTQLPANSYQLTNDAVEMKNIKINNNSNWNPPVNYANIPYPNYTATWNALVNYGTKAVKKGKQVIKKYESSNQSERSEMSNAK